MVDTSVLIERIIRNSPFKSLVEDLFERANGQMEIMLGQKTIAHMVIGS
ncbi:hypothetical protein [Infirmifilum uzonense]|nr:hypothetical protein [Infirmifilum uzonense]